MQRPALLGQSAGPAGARARLLAPLAWALDLRDPPPSGARRAARLAVPVICVGNLTAGGAGKTPDGDRAGRAAGRARRRGARGLARARRQPRRPGPGRGAPAHRRRGRRRAAAAGGLRPGLGGARPRRRRPRRRGGRGGGGGDGRRAAEPGSRQGSVAGGGGRRLRLRQRPGDPGRPPARAGGRRASPAPISSSPSARRRSGRASARAGPGCRCRSSAARWRRSAPAWTGRGLRALAFAGIGRPEKFFASLRALGVELVGRAQLPDHEPFAPRALARLEAEATARHAQLVTTEKDAARLPRPSAPRCWSCRSASSSRTGPPSTRRWPGSGSDRCRLGSCAGIRLRRTVACHFLIGG